MGPSVESNDSHTQPLPANTVQASDVLVFSGKLPRGPEAEKANYRIFSPGSYPAEWAGRLVAWRWVTSSPPFHPARTSALSVQHSLYSWCKWPKLIIQGHVQVSPIQAGRQVLEATVQQLLNTVTSQGRTGEEEPLLQLELQGPEGGRPKSLELKQPDRQYFQVQQIH